MLITPISWLGMSPLSQGDKALSMVLPPSYFFFFIVTNNIRGRERETERTVLIDSCRENYLYVMLQARWRSEHDRCEHRSVSNKSGALTCCIKLANNHFLLNVFLQGCRYSSLFFSLSSCLTNGKRTARAGCRPREHDVRLADSLFFFFHKQSF